MREECKALAEAGVRERIVLTGINLGSYRFDGGQGEALMLDGLMQALLDDTADVHEPGQPPCRFRISSIEPADVSDKLIDVMARSNGRICRHLHLPLQSGSTKVLAEMNRPYTAQQFEALVNKLYAKLPELSLSTDIICGFPGETDADFQETLDVAQRCRFSKIHVFPYSQREGTPAAARTDSSSARNACRTRPHATRACQATTPTRSRKQSWHQRAGAHRGKRRGHDGKLPRAAGSRRCQGRRAHARNALACAGRERAGRAAKTRNSSCYTSAHDREHAHHLDRAAIGEHGAGRRTGRLPAAPNRRGVRLAHHRARRLHRA
ncbi:MAG: radical SAM protein [Senegalimassilia faecalis]